MLHVWPFLSSLKDLGPSYKTDLDFWDCFGSIKTLSCNQRNTVKNTKDHSWGIKNKICLHMVQCDFEALAHKIISSKKHLYLGFCVSNLQRPYIVYILHQLDHHSPAI